MSTKKFCVDCKYLSNSISGLVCTHKSAIYSQSLITGRTEYATPFEARVGIYSDCGQDAKYYKATLLGKVKELFRICNV